MEATSIPMGYVEIITSQHGHRYSTGTYSVHSDPLGSD